MLHPRRPLGTVIALLTLILVAPAALSAAPRALPVGERPDDARLGELRNLNGYFPFHGVDSKEQWQQRRKELRRRARIATGLWPWPDRTPLNAQVYGRVKQEGYTVEKVHFESVPGHYVTGSLYRPVGYEGPRPAVLSPHGHWPGGRFYDAAEHGGGRNIKQQIAVGAERFRVGGRSPLQARAVQLARMGCVVFLYDMIGYADSVQLEHRPGVRERMNSPENWGFFSPQAELRMQNMMGQQTWNSVRAVDFVLSLEDVDPERIGVTGASGGGTQTFMLGAVDERPDVLFPAVMVSTAMQGGCTCENACYLRINGGNIDLAALAAPRPLGMTGANDWTAEIESKGLPDLKELYGMLGHKDRVMAKARTYFNHNYNSVSRTVMYNWMNEHLGLGFEEPVLEEDYPRMTAGGLSVWDAEHPRPSGEEVGDSHERALLRWWTEQDAKHVGGLVPSDSGSLAEHRRVVGGAWDTILVRRLADAGEVSYEQTEKVQRDGHLRMTGLLTRRGERQEQLPVMFLHPEDWNGRVVVWITGTGKAGLLNEDGEPIAGVAELVEGGISVMGVDLLMQGEFVEGGDRVNKVRTWHQRDGSAGWHRYAGYTYGYNHPLFVRRVHDILTAIRFVETDNEHDVERIDLAGFGPMAGPLVAAARSRAGDAVARTAIDTGGFRFAGLDRLDHPMFVPGAVKYQDVPGLLALCAPHRLWVAGEGGEPSGVAAAAYRAAGRAEGLSVSDAPAERVQERAAEWLMR